MAIHPKTKSKNKFDNTDENEAMSKIGEREEEKEQKRRTCEELGINFIREYKKVAARLVDIVTSDYDEFLIRFQNLCANYYKESRTSSQNIESLKANLTCNYNDSRQTESSKVSIDELIREEVEKEGGEGKVLVDDTLVSEVERETRQDTTKAKLAKKKKRSAKVAELSILNKTSERKSLSNKETRKKLKLRMKKKGDAEKTLEANVETVFKSVITSATTTITEISSNLKTESEIPVVSKNPSKKAKIIEPTGKSQSPTKSIDQVDRALPSLGKKPSKKSKKKRTSTLSSRRSTTLSTNKTMDSVINSNLDNECKLSMASVKSINPIANSSVAPWFMLKVKNEPTTTNSEAKISFNPKTPAKTINKIIESSFADSNLKTVVKQTGKQMKTMTKNSSVENEESNQISANIHGSGKVKQMVELVEARMKTAGVPSTPATIKQASKYSQLSTIKQKPPSGSSTTSSTLHPSTQIKSTKLRSSIDNRKQRISSSKTEVKRQSMKRVNAFLKDVAHTCQKVAATETSTKKPAASGLNVKKQLNYDSAEAKTKTGNLDSAEPTHPQACSLNPIHQTRPLTTLELIAANPVVSSQYRVVSLFKTNLDNIKHHEINTPTKINKIEIEERRKQELLEKEEKERKRLIEREKVIQEKIESAKKKREEKVKKVNDVKAKKQLMEEKRREEYEKLKEAEVKKKQLDEKQKLLNNNNQRIFPGTPSSSASASSSSSSSSAASSHSKKPEEKSKAACATPLSHLKPEFVKPTAPAPDCNSTYEVLTTFKSNYHAPKMKLLPGQVIHEHKEFQNSPKPQVPIQNKILSVQQASKYNSTSKSSQEIYDNYNISSLKSEDDTDDEEEPRKPIPQWAKDPKLKQKAITQSVHFVNFTHLFKSAGQNEINLEDIFKVKRKKFTERSSSANWNSPPVWRTGLNGEQSFRLLNK